LIVVLDASTFVSAALKANSLPERALLRALDEPNRVILSQEVEDEYREVIFRRKFDRFVSEERRRHILDIMILAAGRSNRPRRFGGVVTLRTKSIWR
jgi:uncharacterized protein